MNDKQPEDFKYPFEASNAPRKDGNELHKETDLKKTECNESSIPHIELDDATPLEPLTFEEMNQVIAKLQKIEEQQDQGTEEKPQET
mmetsp:Transcript_41296/g.54286  ORF Transcript_41296/g.54286 Transcript_41296/m.54286 type:complete len:87 (-) Transcript_41296:278-538(-)